MFNTLGERITYCRSLLGLTRNELVDNLCGKISLPTLARWELNVVRPNDRKIEMLRNYIINSGINVSFEWLRDGVGYPPISLELKKFNSSQFDEIAYFALIDIRNKIKDFHFDQANSNFFQPIASFGDYIGGVIESNRRLINNKICFLFTENIKTAGIYNYEKNALSNITGNLQDLTESKDIRIGELQWIIRRP